MAPTTQRAIIGGRLDCAVTKRDDAGRVRRLTAARRWHRPGGGDGGERVPWPAAPIAIQRTGGTPLMPRAGGTPCTCVPAARNRIRFFEIAIHPRRSRPDDPCPGNGPFLLNRRVPGGKSVIAVACLGAIRRSQSPPSGSGKGREADVLDAVAGADGGDGVSYSEASSIRAAAA